MHRIRYVVSLVLVNERCQPMWRTLENEWASVANMKNERRRHDAAVRHACGVWRWQTGDLLDCLEKDVVKWKGKSYWLNKLGSSTLGGFRFKSDCCQPVQNKREERHRCVSILKGLGYVIP